MGDVVKLADRRTPVWYTIRIGHHWTDALEVIVEDVADDPRSRESVRDALRRLAGVGDLRDAAFALANAAASEPRLAALAEDVRRALNADSITAPSLA